MMRLARRAHAAAGGAAGFTLVELLVSLGLLILALLLAAQLLGETEEMMVDAAAQVLDPAAALVAMRLRNDVQGATSVVATQLDLQGDCAALQVLGNSEGPIYYQLSSGALWRSVVVGADMPPRQAKILPGVSAFRCGNLVMPNAAPMAWVDYHYTRSRTRRSPLVLLPAFWAPRQEQASDTLFLTPRGAGLGQSW
jgi:type II secretory pathway pseudopilin PulG